MDAFAVLDGQIAVAVDVYVKACRWWRFLPWY
jgi:hypothetical protein